MKFLLIASWIAALHSYPQSSSGYNYSPSDGGSSQLSSECNSDSSKGPVSCGGGGGGYPEKKPKKAPTDGYPMRREPEQNKPLADTQFGGYPARREQMQVLTSGRDEFSGYPSPGKMKAIKIPANEGYPSVDTVPGPGPGLQQEPITQIQKHVYFHAAPPEPEPEQQRRPTSPGARQKHYTIIFIDTSRFSTPSRQQQQSLAAKNEEKTIVYVLVKKPDEQVDEDAPIATSAPPNKPEVFFIKYKDQRESRSETPTQTMDQSKQEGTGGGQYLPPTMA